MATSTYLPYWRGASTFGGLLRIGGSTSTGLAGTVQSGLTVLLGSFGLAGSEHAASMVVRLLALTVLATAVCLLARSRRIGAEPWRAAAVLFCVFLLVTPWFLPWYVVGAVALVIPLGDDAIRRAVLTFSGATLIPAPGLGGAIRSALRYGIPALVFGRSRRRARRGDGLSAAPPLARLGAPDDRRHGEQG